MTYPPPNQQRHDADGADDRENDDRRHKVAPRHLELGVLDGRVHRADHPRQAQTQEHVHAVAPCHEMTCLQPLVSKNKSGVTTTPQ